MKKLKILSIIMLVTFFSCNKEDDEVIDGIHIPDANFKSVLVNDSNINTNGDSEISETEALNFTGQIKGENASIKSVEGIAYFKNVTKISLFSSDDTSNNEIRSIDLSNNTKVTQLLLEGNSLESLDVSALTELTDLKAHSSALNTVTIANGNNANMTRMELYNNYQLSCIKVDVGATNGFDGWNKPVDAIFSVNCN